MMRMCGVVIMCVDMGVIVACRGYDRRRGVRR